MTQTTQQETSCDLRSIEQRRHFIGMAAFLSLTLPGVLGCMTETSSEQKLQSRGELIKEVRNCAMKSSECIDDWVTRNTFFGGNSELESVKEDLDLALQKGGLGELLVAIEKFSPFLFEEKHSRFRTVESDGISSIIASFYRIVDAAEEIKPQCSPQESEALTSFVEHMKDAGYR